MFVRSVVTLPTAEPPSATRSDVINSLLPLPVPIAATGSGAPIHGAQTGSRGTKTCFGMWRM